MDNYKKQIDALLKVKRETVSKLISEIKVTKNAEYRINLIYALVDNFKDERITSTLINLINREDLKNYNGSIIFACNEYSPEEFKPYLELFVGIVISGDYEASWNSASLILDFSEPYEWEEKLLDDLTEKLKLAMKDKKNSNRQFIKEVLRKIG